MSGDTPMTPSSHALQKTNSTASTSIVSSDQTCPPNPPLSREDKIVLYAILQDLADEIRRIDRERKKTQKER